MAKKYNEDYHKEHMLPNRDLPEEEKTDKYHKAWAKSIYSKYYNNRAGIPRDFQGDIDLLRMYGKGNQPQEFYQRNFLKRSTDSTASSADTSPNRSLSSLMDARDNIDWTIISIAPRIKSMIKAYLESAREDMFIDAIDANSGATVEDAKWQLWAYAQNKDFINDLQVQAGLQQQEPSFTPSSIEELSAYESIGGFKLSYAKSMEKLIQYTMALSGYEDELNERLLDDFLDIGFGVTRTYLDKEDNKFKDEYVNPRYFVIQYSENNDFSDSEYVGHVEQITASQLRVRRPELSEEDLEGICYAYANRNGNPSDADWSKYRVINDDGNRGYDSFLIDVFHCEWVDIKFNRKLFYTGRYGGKSMIPLKRGEEIKPLSPKQEERGVSQKEINSNLRRLRICSWVIGTDYISEWGLGNLQDRPAKNKVLHNYHVRCLPDAPIIAQLKPVFDNLQIGWIRFQDARARALKAGVAINFDKLKNIEDVAGKYSVAQILKMFVEDGILFYRESLRGRYEGGKSLPIEQIPSNILNDIQEFTAMWDHSFAQLEGLTGISPLMLGASPDPDTTLGANRLSVSSSANALKPLGLSLNLLKRKSAESLMRRLQLAFKARPDIAKGYIGVVGESDIEVLKLAEKSGVQYGLFPEIRPSDDEKISILNAAELSLQNRREGRPGIDLQTNMYIKAQVSAGANLKELSFLIGYYEKKIGDEDHRKKIEGINAQNQGIAQQLQMSNQHEVGLKQAEFQTEMMKEDKKGTNKMRELLLSKTPEEALKMIELMSQLGISLQPPMGAPKGLSPAQPPQVPLGQESPQMAS